MEPLGYKFIGTYFTWLVTEWDDDSELEECQPLYALIEDEE